MTLPSPYRVDWSPAGVFGEAEPAHFIGHYPVRLKDGCHLTLPLVPLPGGEKAIALLMSNQTSFEVERNIAVRMTDLAREAAPEAVVGIPTLGLIYARPMAEAIGLADYVALGHSRKFWYDDALSEAVVSSTSPDQTKRLYLDPALLERVNGKRVVVVDDVLNTGATMAAAIRLLQRANATIVAITAVLTEGWDWFGELARIDSGMPSLVRSLGHIPLFGLTDQGWAPLPETKASACPGI